MLEGTRVRLNIHSPEIDNPIARTGLETISNTRIEFNNSSFLDLSGDPYNVVAAEFDVVGSQIRYKIVEQFGGRFTNVDDDTGFNGWKMTFLELYGNKSVRIANVDVLSDRNTLEIPKANVTFSRDSVFVNVDGLSYSRGEELAVQIGFRIAGTERGDVLEGDLGRDVLYGKGGKDVLFGGAGNDTLDGGDSNDMLYGGTGRDSLRGGTGADQLFGGTGNDTLSGGTGGDTLTGGRGADVFVFQSRTGRDVITDFDAGVAGERIDLRGIADITSFSDLRANHLWSYRGDAVINLGGGNKVILEDVSTRELSANDFLF